MDGLTGAMALQLVRRIIVPVLAGLGVLLAMALVLR
jgi:hypothetical protein